MFENKKIETRRRLPELNKRISYAANGITTSLHLLKGGDEDPYFLDFDKIVQEPEACKDIGEWFLFIIDIIKADNRKPEFLVFIEKEGIGTVGAISFSAYLSAHSGIPNVFYRESRRLPSEKMKISEKYMVSKKKKLEGKKTLIISDVATTGHELKNAISSVRKEGGKVSDILLYFSRLGWETTEELLNQNINIHYLLNQPLIRKFAWEETTEQAKKVRQMFNKIDKEAKTDGPVLLSYTSSQVSR